MSNTRNVDRLVAHFPVLRAVPGEHLSQIEAVLHFPVLEPGAVAYEQGGECANYLMCLNGRTRVFKLSPAGRELLIYKVEAGGTCVLTTQCLLTRTHFPCESIAEERTELAAISAAHFYRLMAEAPTFRDFVIADYTKLLGSMFSFLDTVTFASLEQRLARRLIADANAAHIVDKTHQQLASDVGSVREVVSRHLGEWERHGWVRTGRGQIEILDVSALASRQAH